MSTEQTTNEAANGGSALNDVLCLLTDKEKSAALRFCETCDDGEGYDVPRTMMKRLEELGLVIDKKFGRFEQTDLLLDIRDDIEQWSLMHNTD